MTAHVRTGADPLRCNDDARQCVPCFGVGGAADDDVCRYYLDAIFPPGYVAVFRAASMVVSPRTFSKVLPYCLLGVIAVGVAVAGWSVGGAAVSFGAVALLLAASVFPNVMMGGAPRCFGLPMVALSSLALARGRALWLAFLTVASALLYPVVTVVIGAALALLLLAVPSRLRGDAAGWSLRRRVGLLASAAALCLLAAVPLIVGGRGYGQRLTAADGALFPEAGELGRYTDRETGGGLDRREDAYRVVWETLRTDGEPFLHPLSGVLPFKVVVLAVGGVAAAGLFLLVRREQNAQVVRLLALAAAVPAAYLSATVASPWLYFPERHLRHALPVLLVLMIPIGAWGAAGGVSWLRRRGWARAAATVAVPGLVVLLLGGRVCPSAGYTVNASTLAPVFEVLRELPAGSLVAGWPKGALDSVSYFTGREVFISWETHQALHGDFVLDHRRRMNALIDAYLATDLEPVRRLRDDWGVSHLLVDGHILGSDGPPSYFEPFDEQIAAGWQEARTADRGFILLHPVFSDRTAIAAFDGLSLHDLRRLDGDDAESEALGRVGETAH